MNAGLHYIAADVTDDQWLTDALDYDALTHWLMIWPLDIQSSRPVGPDNAPASGGAQPQTPSKRAAPRRDA